MAKFNLEIKSNNDVNKMVVKGEKTDKGFYLEKFNFIIINDEALIIENSIPLKNKIPLKLNKFFPLKYITFYGEMDLFSKLISFNYDDNNLYLEYELYDSKKEIIDNYKVKLECILN